MRSSRALRTVRHACVLAAAMILGAVVAPARATVMVEVPLEDLVREADAVVHGTVARTGTRVVTRGESLDPHTFVWIRVAEWLKGRGGRTVLLRELGGEGALGGLAIQGVPRYEVGEEVVAFLEIHRGGVRTASMAQGKFRVLRGPDGSAMARRDLSGIGFARFGPGGMRVARPRQEEALRLEALRRVIARAQAYGGVEGAVIEEAP